MMRGSMTVGRIAALLLTAGTAGAWSSGLAAAAVMAQPEKSRAKDAEKELAPIRKITMYRSGVGYFERSGQVEGDAELQLRFKTEQINDILKSMVLLDLGGGRIDTVSYGSKEPLSRRLASFGINISGNPSIPELLGQLRGAQVKVTASGETMTGAVVGVEQRQVQPTKDAPPISAPYLNVLTNGALKSVAISAITSLEILDQELSGELNKALAALAEYRADRTKTVDVKFAGKGVSGPRRVVVGYIHEMPVWKTSYRLILPDTAPAKKDEPADAGKKGKGSSASVQGWAIVENNTDQDWENVRLSLVSGRPVSFQMDLYEPLFVARPLIPVPTVPGVAPRAYQGGMDGNIALALADAAKPPPPPPPAPSMAPGAPRSEVMAKRSARPTGGANAPVVGDSAVGFDPISAGQMADYAAAAQAKAGEVGEVFQYELEAPVTVERQRSAMIPILSASMTARRVSIFNLSDRSEHPMRGVEIINDSNLQLLPGPIAVFDGNGGTSTYAGDAQIGHVPAGDKRLLAYAVDLDVQALTKGESNSVVTKIRIINGAFEQVSKVRESTTYAFENKDHARARTVLVEHPRLEGYALVAPDKAAETTTGFYRFEMDVQPGKTGALAVAQERTVSQSVGIINSYNLQQLLEYRRNGAVSEAVINTFREIGARQAVIVGAERELAELDKQMEEISKDQARIRGNMGSIERNSQLYTRYMTKLSEQETQLETLTTTRKEKLAKLEQLRKEFSEYLGKLNVE